MQYKVVWTIDIEANSPQEAAKQALLIQRDKGSEATAFEVKDPNTGKVIESVDLGLFMTLYPNIEQLIENRSHSEVIEKLNEFIDDILLFGNEESKELIDNTFFDSDNIPRVIDIEMVERCIDIEQFEEFLSEQ